MCYWLHACSDTLANTRHCPRVDLTLAQRRRRCTNIKSSLGKCLAGTKWQLLVVSESMRMSIKQTISLGISPLAGWHHRTRTHSSSKTTRTSLWRCDIMEIAGDVSSQRKWIETCDIYIDRLDLKGRVCHPIGAIGDTLTARGDILSSSW